MTLRAIPIEHADQVERLRLLRNLGRETYTHHTAPISEAEQLAWWERMQGRVRAWLYTTPHGLIIGFGLVRQDEAGRWCTTLGVDPDFQGRGYGREITADLVRRNTGPLYGAALRSNPAGVRLHVEADWEPIEGPDPAVAYFRTRDRA
jgi:GNAT superfamily N-acetyltransferase